MRRLAVLLLLAGAARADLAGEVARAFRGKDADGRATALRETWALVPEADERTRNKAASAVGKGLREEAVPSVRMAAFDLLLELRTDRAFDRLVVGAVDPVDAVREHVHGIVRKRADPLLFDAIVRALKEDASWRLRAAMIDLLLSGARPRARRALLEALEDPHPAVATRAAEALELLTGKAFGRDAEKWRAWLAKEAEKAAKRDPDEETVTTTEDDVPVELKKGPILGLVPKLYTVPIRRKRVIFVVDMSGSMRVGARSAHLTELKRAIFGLASDVEFNVLCFDQRLFFFQSAKSLVPATTDNKDEVQRWIDELPAGQKTDVGRSVVTGLAMLKEALRAEPEAEAELFVLTDGRETVKTTSLAAIEAQYRKIPVERCRIHVIALGRHGTPALKVLAERTGGKFVQPGAG